MSGRIARRIRVFGRVQGVGFRPYVHRTATALGLDGWVSNVDGHVEVSVCGPAETVRALVAGIRAPVPPLAVVRHVVVGDEHGDRTPVGRGFTVRPSRARPCDGPREVPPDAAVCDACLRELFDPADRRYRYPFVNCADCGPRATLIEDLPYDRVRTTMRRFPLCPACAAEYADPADRRFHAEPLACPACGPHLTWSDLTGEKALRAAVAAVAAGGVIAVKGLGGFQLVCDATSAEAVSELRRRKHRPDKPFAVMVRDLATARRLAYIGRTERDVLTSPAHPVVLLRARGVHEPAGDRRRTRARAVRLAPQVQPGTRRAGLFLPTTALHHLLLRGLDRPLIVTSGNLAGEPIAVDDDEARRALGAVADGFLTHDRPIHARYDDSVVHVLGRRSLTLRRARGYAPAPLALPVPAPLSLAGAGAQLKHTFTLAEHDRAHIGTHTGDLASAATHEAFRASFADLSRLTGIRPRAVAHDLHPGYLSTQWARGLPVERRIAVQHHHAHVAAVAAEHALAEPFVGVAYDGLGAGDDGTLWGGEVLVADLAGYRRVGRFARAPLPGGEAAVRRPTRMALGYLHGLEALGAPRPAAWQARPFTDRLDARETETVCRMVERGVNCPRASSAGRLFDAVAGLLGLGDTVSYEGQAAVALESAAGGLRTGALPWRLTRTDGLWVYDPAPTLTALLEGVADDVAVGRLAAAFHSTVAEVTAALVERAVAAGAPRTVCLGGGCFQNRRLLTDVERLLRAQDLRVLTGHAVPVNDAGISYGQVAVASALLAREKER
ncbi:carbamoyltransferase HypF [Streptomyces minutiscleroticus]|uniref:Carbamoyltransferase n=1 Tax=Streptomyces minutiscleroticus TaxID=68238 RepID=A0A918KQ54_9ACTN|nr:carbamoyltransferase HypF [Streptomyces minutiscleroticus]GGX69007.1 carbamoyltransferase HypF [Streptomyces minutiscleroticus]